MESMAHATSRRRKTVQDLLALGDEVRAELIDGEIYVAATPFREHQLAVGAIHARLLAWVRARGGLVLIAPMDVHLPSGDVVEPDVIYVREDRKAIVPDWVRGAPDLAVEVVSTSHPERDRIVKRALYARNGIPEYWIVELDEQAIQVLRLADGGYEPLAYFERPAVLTTPTLPGFALPLDEVFE
jgi:Uma2 family endonuclease